MSIIAEYIQSLCSYMITIIARGIKDFKIANVAGLTAENNHNYKIVLLLPVLSDYRKFYIPDLKDVHLLQSTKEQPTPLIFHVVQT